MARVQLQLLLAAVCMAYALLGLHAQATAQSFQAAHDAAGDACPTSVMTPVDRKPWTEFNEDHKVRYMAAVHLGKRLGLHDAFAKLHTAYVSELAADEPSCAFVYWHRAFLIAYETMLRDLSPDFSNVSIPLGGSTPTAASSIETTHCAPFDNSSQVLLEDFENVLEHDPELKHQVLSIASRAKAAHAKAVKKKKNAIQPKRNAPASASNVWRVLAAVFGDSAMQSFRLKIASLWRPHEAVPLSAFSVNESAIEEQLLACSSSFPVNKDPESIRLRMLAFQTAWLRVRQDRTHLLHAFFRNAFGSFVDFVVKAEDLGLASYHLVGPASDIYPTESTKINSPRDVHAKAVAMGLAKPKQSEQGSDLDQAIHRWSKAIYQVAQRMRLPAPAAQEQLELILCTYSVECYGGLDPADSRCAELLEQVQTGKKKISIPNWHKITKQHLPCN